MNVYRMQAKNKESMIMLPIMLFRDETGSVFGTGRNENMSNDRRNFVVPDVALISPSKLDDQALDGYYELFINKYKMKQQQKQPLPAIPRLEVQDQEFWVYTQANAQDIDALTGFLTPNAALVQSYLPQPFQAIDETYSALCQMLQLKPHPSIKPRQQKPSNNILGMDNSVDSIPVQTETNSVQFLIFQNTQIDLITLKLLSFLWPLFPNLQVLKIFNIKPSNLELQELCSLLIKNRITKVFIEFMPLETDQLIQLCETIPKCPNLVQVYLRGNRLNDDHLGILIKGFEESQSNIKFLEMTYNSITRRGISAITHFMKKQNKIEYLGFAKNNLSCFDDIRELTDIIVKKKMSPEELQNYRDLEAQREAQIKAQQKQKSKKPGDEPPLIQLEPIVQNADGTFSIVQNSQFRVLNLAMNPFSDADKDLIDRFMGQMQEQFQLVLLQSSMDPKVRDKLKKKYKNLVI